MTIGTGSWRTELTVCAFQKTDDSGRLLELEDNLGLYNESEAFDAARDERVSGNGNWRVARYRIVVDEAGKLIECFDAEDSENRLEPPCES